MWKRATNKASANTAPPAISNPTLFETSLDEEEAAKLQNIVELQQSGRSPLQIGTNSSIRESSAQAGDGSSAPAALSRTATPTTRARDIRTPQSTSPEHTIPRRPTSEETRRNRPPTAERPASSSAPTSEAARTSDRPLNDKPLPAVPRDSRTESQKTSATSTTTTTQPTPHPPSAQTRPPPSEPSMSPPAQQAPRPGARKDSLPPARLDIPHPSGHSHEVSPPDTPRTGEAERSSSPNVSPITDGGSSLRGTTSSSSRTPSTSIPAPIPSGTPLAGWREKIGVGGGGPTTQVPRRKDSKPTKWDKYSGEPTEGPRGKEGTAKPGDPAFDRQPLGNSAVVTATAPAQKANLFSQTLKKVGRRDGSDSPTSPPYREEWKGASGRHAIVDPPSDKAGARQKALPTPSQRRNRALFRPGQSTKHAVAKESPDPETSAARTISAPASQSPPRETTSEDNADRGKRRIADEFTRGNRFSGGSGSKSDESSGRTSSLPPSSVSSPITPSRQAQSSLGSATGTPRQVESPVGGGAPELSHSSYMNSQIATSLSGLSFHNEPGSRFSATTYSTTVPSDSRPETPESSMRDASTPTPQHQSSILNRKRPIPASIPYPAVKSTIKTPSRKPTPSQISVAGAGDSESVISVQPPTGPSTPTAGPPMEPVEIDKVAQLEAHMAALHKRKQNLTTVINELTNVAQPTSMAYDRTSRTEIKKTVNGMTTELASVQKEMHDTGLKLHRALKKRDEEINGEGSGLWIRRVTE